MMKQIDPKEIPTGQLFGLLTGSVAPRPIAFASTMDREGNVNLSPFSFFNVFGANPPTLIFSPSRRVRDNTTKHTLENVLEVPEVVINMVDYAMVEQMSLSSTEYDKETNEFIKAGFSQVASERIHPPRVGESPVAFECLVKDIIKTGDQGGAGNLVICEIILAHFADHIFGEDGRIDPRRLDAVARLGSNWYCRANGDALFEVAKPGKTKGIGFDQLPDFIRNSTVLSGNDLGQLAGLASLPNEAALTEWEGKAGLVEFLNQEWQQIQEQAKQFIATGEIEKAMALLLLSRP